jgi:hypothetical protein
VVALDGQRYRNAGIMVFDQGNASSCRPVVDAAFLIPEPALEQVAVLAQVMQQTRNAAPLPLSELVREAGCKLRHGTQVILKELPIAT